MIPMAYPIDSSKIRQTLMSSPKLLKIHAANPINNPKSTTCPPKINPPKLAF
jgi:hypothetical protein